jgi:hypothetical protein
MSAKSKRKAAKAAANPNPPEDGAAPQETADPQAGIPPAGESASPGPGDAPPDPSLANLANALEQLRLADEERQAWAEKAQGLEQEIAALRERIAELEEAPVDPLALEERAQPYVQVFVAGLLAEYERRAKFGPHGQGWRHNETKREEVETIASFLRRLDDAVKGATPLLEA